MQHHLTKSFISRIQLKKVFSQRKQTPRSNRLYIERYQEIDVGLNDFGKELLLSSKIYHSWSWPKPLYLNWLAPLSVSNRDMLGFNLLASVVTVKVIVWLGDGWMMSGSIGGGVNMKVYAVQLHQFQRILKIIFHKIGKIEIFIFFWLLLSLSIHRSLCDSSVLMIFFVMGIMSFI